jgi:hypothetical protein
MIASSDNSTAVRLGHRPSWMQARHLWTVSSCHVGPSLAGSSSDKSGAGMTGGIGGTRSLSNSRRIKIVIRTRPVTLTG